MAVLYSVQGVSTSGQQSISLPDANALLVGVQVFGVVSIVLDPSRNAILATNGGTTTQGLTCPNYIPVHFRVTGFQLTYTNVAGAPIIFLFGDRPIAGSRPLQVYQAVYVQATLSTGGAAVTATLNFPSGLLHMVGAILLSSNPSGGFVTATFPTSSGRSLTIGTLVNAQSDPAQIIPLEHIPTASTLTVTFVEAATAATVATLVVYYQ